MKIRLKIIRRGPKGLYFRAKTRTRVIFFKRLPSSLFELSYLEGKEAAIYKYKHRIKNVMRSGRKKTIMLEWNGSIGIFFEDFGKLLSAERFSFGECLSVETDQYEKPSGFIKRLIEKCAVYKIDCVST